MSGPTGVTSETMRKPRNDEIDVYGVTHSGRVRPQNQDHFLIAALSSRLTPLQTSLPSIPEYDVLPSLPESERAGFLAMVADGVGGGVQGAEASQADWRAAGAARPVPVLRSRPCPSDDDGPGIGVTSTCQLVRGGTAKLSRRWSNMAPARLAGQGHVRAGRIRRSSPPVSL